jgi:hypothetical protein
MVMSADRLSEVRNAVAAAIRAMGRARALIDVCVGQLRSAEGGERVRLIRRQMELEAQWDAAYREYTNAQAAYHRRDGTDEKRPETGSPGLAAP